MSKEPVERIVIGKPMQPNGQPSENLARVQQFVARWKKAQPDIPIEYVDERFTSVGYARRHVRTRLLSMRFPPLSYCKVTWRGEENN